MKVKMLEELVRRIDGESQRAQRPAPGRGREGGGRRRPACQVPSRPAPAHPRSPLPRILLEQEPLRSFVKAM